MVANVKLVDICHHFLNALDARIAKLKQFPTVKTDEMIVLPVAIRPLVFGLISAELMLDHKITFKEQFKRIVNGCSAYPSSLLLKTQVEFVSIDVVVGGIDFFEHSKSLGSLPLPALFQKRPKDILDLFELLGRNRHDPFVSGSDAQPL